jgi:hypothetical protein
MSEPLSIRGTLRLTATDRRGRVRWRTAERNMVVAGGYLAVARAMAGDPGAHLAAVALGSCGDPAALTDTAIANPTTLPATVEALSPAKVSCAFHLAYGQANGSTIREFGLMTADGALFSRKARQPIEKTEDLSLSGEWVIEVYDPAEASPPDPELPDDSCIVTFDASDASGGSPREQVLYVRRGARALPPEDPTAPAGAAFTGWRHGADLWSFSSPVAQDMTLYASWEAIGVATAAGDRIATVGGDPITVM